MFSREARGMQATSHGTSEVVFDPAPRGVLLAWPRRQVLMRLGWHVPTGPLVHRRAVRRRRGSYGRRLHGGRCRQAHRFRTAPCGRRGHREDRRELIVSARIVRAGGMRKRVRWLRRDAHMRRLPERPGVRRSLAECVQRRSALCAHHVPGIEGALWIGLRWLRQGARLRRVPQRQELRREKAEHVRLTASPTGMRESSPRSSSAEGNLAWHV